MVALGELSHQPDIGLGLPLRVSFRAGFHIVQDSAACFWTNTFLAESCATE